MEEADDLRTGRALVGITGQVAVGREGDGVGAVDATPERRIGIEEPVAHDGCAHGAEVAGEGAREPGELPYLDTLTQVPTAASRPPAPRKEGADELDEETWRKRFRTLRIKIDRKERLLALKRAELYDKIKKGETEKKPRRFSIEGFVINTEKKGDEPRFIDPLEREVYEMEQVLERLRLELRELNFRASVAGVPKAWRR